MNNKPYPKPLKTKIKIPSLPLPPTILFNDEKAVEKYNNQLDSRDKKVKKQISQEWHRKLPLLMQHYDIDPNADNSWQRLAISLAIRHI